MIYNKIQIFFYFNKIIKINKILISNILKNNLKLCNTYLCKIIVLEKIIKQ